MARCPRSHAPSPFGLHSKVVFSTGAALKNAIDAAKCNATLLGELDWIIAADTVVRPDVLIVCGPEPARHLESPPSVVVEVLSERTRDRDLHHKRQLYEEQDVAYYLILDPDGKQLTALGRDQSNKFAELLINDSQLVLDIYGNCRLIVPIDRLFS